jgi:UPF0716 protein FxsA
MLAKLLAAFILIPLVEFFLLVWIAQQTSLVTTIVLVVATGVLGSLLARSQGLRALRNFRQSIAEGRMPGKEIQDGLMIAFAAALMLTPGLLTDALGLFLLVPQTRALARRYMARHLINRFEFKVESRMQSDSETFEAKYWSASNANPRPTGSVRRDATGRRNGDTIDATRVRALGS